MTGIKTFKHYMYVPFSGLGLYGGFRGNRWLRNRITVFKNFVVPSLLNQTNKDFTLWVGWRPEERDNVHVLELKDWLDGIGLKNIFTYGGLCFWDDKYEDDVAKSRLTTALHRTLPDLLTDVGDSEYVYMTIQPSDDCYTGNAVETIHNALKNDIQAFGYTKGYIMNYQTKEVSEYNPTTNPPFYTIKFKKETFIDPQKHVEYAPIKSHEYVANHLRYGVLDERGFLVGCHGENVSTFYNHPFKGEKIETTWDGKHMRNHFDVLNKFGIAGTTPLKLPISIRKKILRMLPYRVQRKLRYWFGELIYTKIYEYLRS